MFWSEEGALNNCLNADRRGWMVYETDYGSVRLFIIWSARL